MEEEQETKKVTLEDGSIKYESIDGKQYKSRSGAWKRNQKLRADDLIDDSNSIEVKPEEKEGPDWTSFDWGSDPQSDVEFIPSPLKQLKRPVEKKNKSRAEIEADLKTSIAMLKVLYKSGDFLMSKYKQAMLEDRNASVTHSEQDYEWISGVTNNALEHKGLNVSSFLGPTLIAGVANTYWFGAPIYKISKQSKKSLFKGRGGFLKSILSKLPIIGKRFKKKPETVLKLNSEASKDDDA